MLRRFYSSSVSVGVTASGVRHVHTPGWQTSTSTKDIRTREQRDLDRRLRQLEKLPRPEVLHDFQYPYEKTVLCDSWFQPPVYESELDTPALFNLYPPNDFFVYFNVSDFERSQYPPVPEMDCRTLIPSSSSLWRTHIELADKLLRKHEIVPQILPFVDFSVNMSVVFGETNRDVLDRKNFWKSALFGNYMELKECHNISAPEVFLKKGEQEKEDHDDDCYYTMMMMTPDYPSRAEAFDSNFFLHYCVANLKPSSSSSSSSSSTKKDSNDNNNNNNDAVQVVNYVPPLPTEDAGCSRIICVLFKQNGKFEKKTSGGEISFAERCSYRLHASSSSSSSSVSPSSSSSTSSASASSSSSLAALEELIEDPTPKSACFFQTNWDIQVQEWYEANDLPEPRYYPSDIVELTEYNALPLDWHQVTSRHGPHGEVRDETVMEQVQPTVFGQNSASKRMSSATLLSKDKKPMIRPRYR